MATTKSKNADSVGANYGTFTKGDRTVVAYSRKRAVELRYDGWKDASTGTSSPPAEQPNQS